MGKRRPTGEQSLTDRGVACVVAPLVRGKEQSTCDDPVSERWYCGRQQSGGGRSQKAQVQILASIFGAPGYHAGFYAQERELAWLGMLLGEPTHAAEGEYIWGRSGQRGKDQNCCCVGERSEKLREGWRPGRWRPARNGMSRHRVREEGWQR